MKDFHLPLHSRNVFQELGWSPHARHTLRSLSVNFNRFQSLSITLGRYQSLSTHLFFARQKKKGFSFFPCGATSSRTVPNTQPLQVAFSLRERVDLRSQKGGFWEENCLGKGGADRAKKGKKDAQKKVGQSLSVSFNFGSIRGRKAHESLAQKKLCTPRSSVFLVGPLDKKVYVLWIVRIAHTSWTPGHPTGRLSPHRRGHRPKRFMLMRISFPDSSKNAGALHTVVAEMITEQMHFEAKICICNGK